VVFALLVLAWIDFKSFRLPDTLTIPLAAYGLIANIFLDLGWANISSALIGCVLGYSSLFLLNQIHLKLKKVHGIGMGDAKLLAALGALFGWENLPYILSVASISGLLGGYIWLKIHQQNTAQPFPFGPFIALGGLCVLIQQWFVLN